MTTISVSKAKTHFDELLDIAQREPVTIEKHGRPVAVLLSYEKYQKHYENAPSQLEKEQALKFLDSWSKRPPINHTEEKVQYDMRAKAIWNKYSQEK